MTMCTYFGTIGLIIILWTSICLQDAQAIRKLFKVVEKCPFNESEWKMRAAHTTCNGSDSYHCLLTEGGVTLREQCTETSLFTKGFCPIFTNEGYLQWSPCKDTACPKTSYRSDEVFEYQICYQKTDKPKRESTEQGSNNNSCVTGVIIVAILFAFVLVSVLVVFYKRNQFGFKDIRIHYHHNIDTDGLQDVEKSQTPEQAQLLIQQDVENGQPPEQAQPLIQQEPVYAKPAKDITKKGKFRSKHYEIRQKTYKMTDLFKYLVHIMKQELDVNDLKEKVVIHSKSINEYFCEPIIKSLQSIKYHNDYDHLDMSLVFALLQNFCDGIKPSSRGWDYEPPDDETHVGADIERIRSMWNKYCDEDLEFKHLDDVYNRMKQKYGTVAVHRDDAPPIDGENEEGFELLKDKIHSIKLNPDCTVEKGIVITDKITRTLKILKSRKVVILKGAIGCGKTHALKAIQNYFQEKNWETAWVKSEEFEGKISLVKPTIFFCDNLFGKLGASVFSQDAVNKTEKALKEIEISKQETKVVIGIHTHVYDEVKKNLKLNFLHEENITVEMDKLSDAESLLIFKEQLKKGHCKMDNDCWFKIVGFQSVLDKLSKHQGHIGGPLLSLMYCNQHELFSDEAFSVNPVQTLVHYLKRMRQDSPRLYDCLVYLMCVQQHNIEEEPEMWAGHISADITKQNLMELPKTSGLLQVENKRVTLAHELLTTALFKSAANRIHIFFLPVLKKCDSDVFLQLLRPSDGCQSDLYYKYNELHESKEVGKMCALRLARIYKEQEIAHPLMSVELVKDKYIHYLKHEPKYFRL